MQANFGDWLIHFVLCPFQLEYREPMELNPKGCGCYTLLSTNCWRHSLKNCEIINYWEIDDVGSFRIFFESAIIGKK